MFSKYLRDGSNHNGNLDYAGTDETIFLWGPDAEVKAEVARMIVQIEDNAPLVAEDYGSNISLTEGITVGIYKNVVLQQDLTDGIPITSNANWGRYCYDVEPSDFGAGNNYVRVRWTFEKSGAPISLQGSYGEQIGVALNDDFSGLVSHTFLVQGTFHTGR